VVRKEGLLKNISMGDGDVCDWMNLIGQDEEDAKVFEHSTLGHHLEMKDATHG
jgi:hypothetical protein